MLKPSFKSVAFEKQGVALVALLPLNGIDFILQAAVK
jgi:hypothetical protein